MFKRKWHLFEMKRKNQRFLLPAIVWMSWALLTARLCTASINSNFDIYRNNPLPPAMASTSQDYIPGLTYNYNQDSYPQGNAVAHSGSAVSSQQTPDSKMYQHVYAYSQSDTDTEYQVHNEAEHSHTSTIESVTYKQVGKNITIKDNLSFDGSLLLATDSSGDKGFCGLLARTDILVTITPNPDRPYKTKKIKGSIDLVGKKNGKIKIKTTGKIKKRMLSVDQDSDGLFKIDLSDVLIPYKTKVRFDVPFTVDTKITSIAQNQGYGTGAEVLLLSGLPSSLSTPVLPSFMHSTVVPEPASILFILLGSLAPARLHKKKQTRHLTIP